MPDSSMIRAVRLSVGVAVRSSPRAATISNSGSGRSSGGARSGPSASMSAGRGRGSTPRRSPSDIAAEPPQLAAGRGLDPELGEEPPDRLLRARTAGDPLPARLDHPDEPVALVDR